MSTLIDRSSMIERMKSALKLDLQLESINYDRPNFVHADLDVESFNQLQAARGTLPG